MESHQLAVNLDTQFTAPTIEFGVVSQFEFYAGRVEIDPLENPSRITRFTPVS